MENRSRRFENEENVSSAIDEETRVDNVSPKQFKIPELGNILQHLTPSYLWTQDEKTNLGFTKQ